MVRCKFRVTGIKAEYRDKHEKRDGQYVLVGREKFQTVEMAPVYANNDPNHENSKFWAASPSGSLTLGTVNGAAVEELEKGLAEGGEFYIDITRAGA